MQCAKAKCTVTNFKSMFKVHQFAVNDSFVSKNCPHSCQESKSLKVSLQALVIYAQNRLYKQNLLFILSRMSSLKALFLVKAVTGIKYFQKKWPQSFAQFNSKHTQMTRAYLRSAYLVSSSGWLRSDLPRREDTGALKIGFTFAISLE